MDIAEKYPNDSDIICKFTYDPNVSMTGPMISDRVGLFRESNLKPHEYKTFKWVEHSEKLEKNIFQVCFKAVDLPKNEDFYQFQCLKTAENGSEVVIGISNLFQLKNSKDQEVVDLKFKNSKIIEQLCEMKNKQKQLQLEIEKKSEEINQNTRSEFEEVVKARDLAEEKVKKVTLKSDEQQKKIQALEDHLSKLEIENKHMKQQLQSQFDQKSEELSKLVLARTTNKIEDAIKTKDLSEEKVTKILVASGYHPRKKLIGLALGTRRIF